MPSCAASDQLLIFSHARSRLIAAAVHVQAAKYFTFIFFGLSVFVILLFGGFVVCHCYRRLRNERDRQAGPQVCWFPLFRCHTGQASQDWSVCSAWRFTSPLLTCSRTNNDQIWHEPFKKGYVILGPPLVSMNRLFWLLAHLVPCAGMQDSQGSIGQPTSGNGAIEIPVKQGFVVQNPDGCALCLFLDSNLAQMHSKPAVQAGRQYYDGGRLSCNARCNSKGKCAERETVCTACSGINVAYIPDTPRAKQASGTKSAPGTPSSVGRIPGSAVSSSVRSPDSTQASSEERSATPGSSSTPPSSSRMLGARASAMRGGCSLY